MFLEQFGTFLNVVIVLFLAYLLLSLSASYVQEAIVGIFGIRGRMLRRRVEHMLNDPGSNGLAGQVFRTGLISSLGSPGGHDPSYIEPTDFADAVHQVLEAEGGFESGVMHPTLLAFARETKGDMAIFKTKVADWYAHVMDRATGSYRRRTRFAQFLGGLILALAFNVDTIDLVKGLWGQRGELEVIVQAYEQTLEESGLTDEATEEQIGDVLETQEFRDSVAEILMMDSLPYTTIGWWPDKPEKIEGATWLLEIWETFRAEISVGTAFGWLLTAFAVSLGSEFWFNAVGSLLQLRASGVKPSPEGT